MAAIDFPANPSVNQTHTASGITWTWDGTSWKAQGSTTTYTLPTASTGTLGGVKVGGNFSVDGAGTLSLSAAAISGLSDVTAVSDDYLMLWDATDSSLKKVDAGELIGGGGGGGLSSIGIQSGGTQVGAGITQLNFIGTGNTFAVSGNTVDVSISGNGGGDTVDAILPVAYAVVGTNSAGTGTGMSWGAYNSSTKEVVFTFDTAQPNTNYYVHTNREHFATHNIEVLGKSTTGFTTRWTNSDTSALPPATFKGVVIVYASNPLTSVGALNTNDGVVVKNDGTLVGTAGTINFGENLSVTALSAGIVTVTSSDNLNIAGLSTFTGIGTFGNDLYVGGDLSVLGSTTIDSQTLNVNNVNITGVTTISGITTYSNSVHFGGDQVTWYGGIPSRFMRWESPGAHGILRLSDLTNLYLGTDSNVHIYHEGNTYSHQTVWKQHLDYATHGDQGVNPLVFNSDQVYIKGSPDAPSSLHQTYTAKFDRNDGVKLYYRQGLTGSYLDPKFETASSGVNIVGTTTTRQLAVTGVSTFSDGFKVLAGGVDIVGVVTATAYQGDASALTDLNATKITSGIVPAARLGSGTANNTVFLRGDNTWATPSGGGSGISNVIDDATPELGGHLNLNSKNLTGAGTFTGTPVFDCNVKVKNNRYLQIGDSNALQLTSGGSNVTYTHAAGGLVLFESNFGIDIGGLGGKAFSWRASTNEAEIYYSNSLKLNTTNTGVVVTGICTATTFSGSGADLTALNGSNISSGTIAAARVATLNQDTTGSSGSCTGNAATATKLATARNIGGVAFDGTAAINLPGVNAAGTQDTSGNAATATALATARDIGGVSFDGTAAINLPGVNAAGNQDTSGNAGTATRLEIARTIGGVSFDGTAPINLPGVNAAGNQDTSGNAATATALATARAINGVDFDGTAAITVTAAAGTLSGNTLASGVTASSLTSVGTLASLAVTNNATIGGNAVITGDLTVNGTTTTIDTTTLQVEDKNIEIGKVSSPSDTTADGGGLTLKGATDKTFNWVNSTDAWTSSEHLQVASGKTFIGDGSTLTALNASNLGSGTVPTARLGSGTANNTVFLRGDNTWASVSGGLSDIVNDTTPQLGGNLDLNSKTINGTGTINITGTITATTFSGSFTGDVSGAASQITVADESSDTDAFVVFANTATGNNYPKTGSNLTFNSSTGELSATSFNGELAYHTAWTLGASGSSHYTFTGNGLDGAENDPTIYVIRGQKYAFKNRSGGHPFRIQTSFQNTSGTAYNDGVTNNSAGNGTDLIWNVQFDAPDVLYYQCTAHTNMSGKIIVLGSNVTAVTWTASAGSAHTIDTVPWNSFLSAEYTIHISHSTGVQSEKLLVMCDGTTGSDHHTEYAVLYSGSVLGTFSTTTSGSDVLVRFNPANAGSTTIKFIKSIVQ